jgi:hypothetical protein
MTSAPAHSKARDMERPMPDVPPTTTARLPWRSNIFCGFLCCEREFQILNRVVQRINFERH